MKKRIREIYRSASLATKIRYSYLALLVPIVCFLIFCFYNLWVGNRNYENMINSTRVASEFSLDFKKDFDYETYLLIVENKSIEESELDGMLADANRIVNSLEQPTNSEANKERISSVKKYLSNLESYKERIEENLREGNRYEDNMEIWENDVQIVTSLIRETIFQYIHYEIKALEHSSAEYQKFYWDMIRFSLIAFVCIFLSILFLSYYIPRSITHPIRKLSEAANDVAGGDLSVRFDVRTGAEVQVLSDSLNAMIEKINELVDQVTCEQIRLRKAEFELLQTQINPHFLYNTLDAIVWLAEAGEQKKVVSMVGSLSDFFRTTLNQGKTIVSIKEELQHVRSYLEIQQVRYQDILHYRMDVPTSLNDYRIPKITIQPLVENALYHGIKNKRGGGNIEITGCPEEDCFCIQIRDDGIGIMPERLQEVREGMEFSEPEENDLYGLYNVNERIRLNFGEEYGIQIESIYGEGTVVNIRLPYTENI